MARWTRFSGVTKAITGAGAVQTVIFPPNEIESAGIVMVQVLWTGANNALTANKVNRFRIRASGQTIVDVSIPFLFAYLQRFNKANFPDLTGDQCLTFPFFLPDAPSEEQADICQFPTGSQMQVEVEFGTAAVAGVALCQFIQSDVVPIYTPRLYAFPLNFPAATRNQKYSFSDSGVVRGVILDQAGIDRAQLTISGRNAFEAPGRQFAALTWPTGGLERKEMPYNGTTTATPAMITSSLGIPAAYGSSYLTLDTGAGWAGATNELGLYTVDQQAIVAAAPASAGGSNSR